jgi:hypothetical protein
MKIVLSKEEALEALTQHQERHIEEYKEQFKGWRTAMQEHGEALKEWATEGAEGKRPQEPTRPTNHLKNYQDLIQKLNYHQLDTIEVDEGEFNQIVNDSFYWSYNWLIMNDTYVGDAITAERKIGNSISANAITAGQIRAGSLSGSKIGNLNVDALDGFHAPADHVSIDVEE